MRKPPYLNTPKVGSFYFVRRYPSDVAQFFESPFRKVKLGTRERGAAERKCRELAAHFDRDMDEVRAVHLAKSTVEREDGAPYTPSDLLAPDDIHVVVRRTEASMLHSDDALRASELSDEEYDEYEALTRAHHAQVARDVARARFNAYREEAREAALFSGLQVPAESPLLEALAKSFANSLHRALEGIVQRFEGRAVPTPPEAPIPNSDNDLDSLQRALTYWLHKQRPEKKTQIELEAILGRFVAVSGRSRISAITRADVLAFQQQESARPVQPQTVNKAMSLLRAMVGLACEDAQLGPNPFAGLRSLRVKAGNRVQRRGFLAAELQRVFAGPVYTARPRPDGGAGEAAWWLPVLAYATGARLEELGQLRLSDVTHDGVGHVLHITTMTDAEDEREVERRPSRALPVERRFLSSLRSGWDRHLKTAARGFGLFHAESLGDVPGRGVEAER